MYERERTSLPVYSTYRELITAMARVGVTEQQKVTMAARMRLIMRQWLPAELIKMSDLPPFYCKKCVFLFLAFGVLGVEYVTRDVVVLDFQTHPAPGEVPPLRPASHCVSTFS